MEGLKTRQWGVVIALFSALLCMAASNVNAKSLKNDTSSPSLLGDIHIITNTQLQSNQDSINSLTSILQLHKKINFWALSTNNHINSAGFSYFSEKTKKLKQPHSSLINKKSLLDLFSGINKKANKKKTPSHIFILFDDQSPVPILTNDEYNKISPIIKKFQNNNISISTIHIGSDADKNFHLSALTTATNGKYQKINNIEVLEKEFLNIISFALNLNYLPLHDNLVRINKNADKISFLLFGTNKNLPVQFIPPQGKNFNQYNYPDNVHWIQKKHFDIIHIDKPKKGTWQINTQAHPMNRAIIKSPFQVEISPIPLYLFPHSPQTLSIKLTQENKHITTPEVLDHIVIKVTMLSTHGREQVWFPIDNGRNGDRQAGDGIYVVQLSDALLVGQYNLSIDVDGHLFQRQISTSFNVIAKPFEFFSMPTNDASQHIITIVPYEKLIDSETTTITASITTASREKKEIRLHRKNAFEWQLALDNTPESSPYIVELNMATTTYKGKSLSVWLDPVTIGQKQTQVRKKIIHKHHDSKNHNSLITSQITLEKNSKNFVPTSNEKIKSTSSTWTTPTAQLILANFLFIMLILITFYTWNRHNKKWLCKLRDMLSYD